MSKITVMKTANNTDELVINRLFVYGTLAPGRSNEHVLAALTGSWQLATVRGTLYQNGWHGYPGVVLSTDGSEVQGFVLSSDDLAANWQRIDDFEGDGYRRVLVTASLEEGHSSQVYIYILSGDPVDPTAD